MTLTRKINRVYFVLHEMHLIHYIFTSNVQKTYIVNIFKSSAGPGFIHLNTWPRCGNVCVSMGELLSTELRLIILVSVCGASPLMYKFSRSGWHSYIHGVVPYHPGASGQ